MVPRSYLYVPGDAERKLARAHARGADAVILDLEDAVAPASRPAARQHVRAALAARDTSAGDQAWVRVHPPEMRQDIGAVAFPGLTGIVLPKADPATLREADHLLTAAETDHGLPGGSLAIIALIETAVGLLAAPDVARAPRVARVGLGEADLVAELGLTPREDRSELAWLRLQVVVASSAAGVSAPVGPVETDLADDRRLRSSTQELRALGFRARTALHPRQVSVINEAFSPSAAEVEQARQTVAALADARAQGAGVALAADGSFVDPAVARSAYHTLALHERTMRHNDQTSDVGPWTTENDPTGRPEASHGDERTQ